MSVFWTNEIPQWTCLFSALSHKYKQLIVLLLLTCCVWLARDSLSYLTAFLNDVLVLDLNLRHSLSITVTVTFQFYALPMRAIEAHFHPSLSFFCHVTLQCSKEVLLCRNNSEILFLLFSLYLPCHFIVLLQLASDAFPKDMTLALAYLLALPQVSLTALFADLYLSFSHSE